jgi:hypothetical protein
MTTKDKIILGVVVGLIAVTSAFIGGRVAGGGSLLGGGAYNALLTWFGNGLSAGLTEQFSVDSAGQVTSATTTNTTSYWTVNGVDYASVQISMAATSSVPCSIANPFGATALVLDYFAQVTANGLGTQLIDVSTSSTAYASSSPAFVKRFSAASTFTLPWTPGVASTTRVGLLGYDSFSGAGNSPYVLGASERLNFSIATGTPGTFSSYYTGTCSATVMKG